MSRWTLRGRLTVLYGGLFFLAGAVLLGVTYLLVDQSLRDQLDSSESARLAAARAEIAAEQDAAGDGDVADTSSGSGDNDDADASSGTSDDGVDTSGREGGEDDVDPSSRDGDDDPGDSSNSGSDAGSEGPDLSDEDRAAFEELVESVQADQEQLRETALGSLLTRGGLALAGVGIVAAALGWLVAGRVLRPVHRITETADRIAGANVAGHGLHERISLDGPDDEVKKLADTFDSMLDTLDRSFDAQRRFVANASHELRTPLALNRALVELAVTRPEATDETKRLGDAVLTVNRRHEQLIDGLLTLADSESAVTERSPIDLADVAAHVIDLVPGHTAQAGASPPGSPANPSRRTRADQPRGSPDRAPADPRHGTRASQAEGSPPGSTAPLPNGELLGEAGRSAGVEVRTTLRPAPTAGDPVLVERLVQNLVENAVRHNVPGGWLSVTTDLVGGQATLVVSNTGPTVPAYEVESLFQPFRRLGDRLAGPERGVGLGLSIVRAIARAHGGDATAVPHEGGGLVVTVALPTRS